MQVRTLSADLGNPKEALLVSNYQRRFKPLAQQVMNNSILDFVSTYSSRIRTSFRADQLEWIICAIITVPRPKIVGNKVADEIPSFCEGRHVASLIQETPQLP
jgi:hypothetical protein